MLKLFSILTAANWTGLLVATALGYGQRWAGPQGHVVAGMLAMFLCCAVHCVVFTYFIATAKWVRHACTVKGLSDAFVRPTGSFKTQAFPAALLAMAALFASALSGVLVDGYGARPIWHTAASWAAIAVNVGAACFEYAAIMRNAGLIDQILAAGPDRGAGEAPT